LPRRSRRLSARSAVTSSRSRDYPSALSGAWRRHLQPRRSDAPKVVSLFAGCGGSSLGYEMAGCKIRLAVEWDKDAGATYRLNFPQTPFWPGDITKLAADRALELSGVEPGELDVLDGSPPCQGFSMAGKRQIRDPRNRLFEQYVRLLEAFRPRAFIMENVSGLVRGSMKLVFAEMTRELKAAGYRVSCRLMNAKWHGVPQSRQRLIWIGVREDLCIEPSHPPAQRTLIPVGEALKGCPPTGQVLMGKFRGAWRLVPAGGTMRDALISSSSHFNDVVKLDPRKPAKTVLSTASPYGFATMCRWDQPRALSIREAKRLMSFPDEFIIPEDLPYKRAWKLLGNAVPPLLTEAVARHLMNRIRHQSS